MLGSFIPRFASYGVFQSPSGERFNYLCDALRGEPSIFAEPVEDFFILICPFVPFRVGALNRIQPSLLFGNLY